MQPVKAVSEGGVYEQDISNKTVKENIWNWR